MNELKIIAVILAKETHKNELLKALHTVVDATRKEDGNLSYTLYQDIKNPLKFTIIEDWKSQAAIDYHNKTQHFLAFVKAIENKTDSLTIDVIRKVY